MRMYRDGEQVMIRRDLSCGALYRTESGTLPVGVIPEMTKWAGEIVTIKAYDNRGAYRIAELPCYWTAEMFEPVVEEDFDIASEDELADLLGAK